MKTLEEKLKEFDSYEKQYLFLIWVEYQVCGQVEPPTVNNIAFSNNDRYEDLIEDFKQSVIDDCTEERMLEVIEQYESESE